MRTTHQQNIGHAGRIGRSSTEIRDTPHGITGESESIDGLRAQYGRGVANEPVIHDADMAMHSHFKMRPVLRSDRDRIRRLQDIITTFFKEVMSDDQVMYLPGLIPAQPIVRDKNGGHTQTVEGIVLDHRLAARGDQKPPGIGSLDMTMANHQPGRPGEVLDNSARAGPGGVRHRVMEGNEYLPGGN